jgi:hypothetical protein
MVKRVSTNLGRMHKDLPRTGSLQVFRQLAQGNSNSHLSEN